MNADSADVGSKPTPERASVLRLPRNSRRVFVGLGLVEPELAQFSIDTTPSPHNTAGCGSAAFPIMNVSSRAAILLRAGTN